MKYRKITSPIPQVLLSRRAKWSIVAVVCTMLLLAISTWRISIDAQTKYQTLLSPIIYDRTGVPLSVSENSRGHYVYELTEIPTDFSKVLIQKEDRFFYYHLGINPFSTLRAISTYLSTGDTHGASTITQQLAKIILGTESERTIKHKLIEAFYAVSLELYTPKSEILLMYANAAYLGNQTQGFETASYAYFNKPLHETTQTEQLSLLATLSYPQTRNPWESANTDFAQALHERFYPETDYQAPKTTTGYRFQHNTWFELRTAGIACAETCTTTVDSKVTEVIRTIIDRQIEIGTTRNIRSGAVVVIDAKTNELLTLVGTRDPLSLTPGNQINMAITPRPIGSTVKPLIYAKGFAEGLRPYTLVEDREYKYPIATGFSLYPKNYDGLYRGEVTLHESLSNSLNVPSVKVLEYIGLGNFYHFLSNELQFIPLQPYDSYQYGIALGGLEMDLLTLTHYFTLFPQSGSLGPLHVLETDTENFDLPPQSKIQDVKQVLPSPAIDLVEVILSDRFAGVNQFGLTSNLNLAQTNYGVKTGTSRDFHDSWVVGYTPDFVVGVWLGNTENEPLDQVTGSSGAGAVWREVMEYLFTTNYNKKTPLTQTEIVRIPIGYTDEWGLLGDEVPYHEQILTQNNLILDLYEGDVFALQDNLIIPLRARNIVTWSINGVEQEEAQTTTFSPNETGTYEIMAYDKTTNRREVLYITVTTAN